jgi:hypothetical protein
MRCRTVCGGRSDDGTAGREVMGGVGRGRGRERNVYVGRGWG